MVDRIGDLNAWISNTFAFALPLPIFAASNEETLQYIIADYQDQCEKAQEDFRDIDYEEGDPIVAELGLSDDNIYEITIDKDGKTATVLHAYFSCTNIGFHGAARADVTHMWS